MKNLKRLCLAFVVLLFAGFSVSAFDFQVSGIYYNVISKIDKTVSVTFKSTNPFDCDGVYVGSVVIPEKVVHKGVSYKVTEIGEYAFQSRKELKDVTIPATVTKIGSGAFSGCENLVNVSIPNSVTYIGANAFNNTTFMNDERQGIIYVGNCCIGFCGTYESMEGEIAIKSGTRLIANSAFSGCRYSTSVTIPEGVEYIGEYAFARSGIKSATLPSTIKSIGDHAFESCSDLKRVVLMNPKPPVLGADAFKWPVCDKITLVVHNFALRTYKATLPWKNLKNIVGENFK